VNAAGTTGILPAHPAGHAQFIGLLPTDHYILVKLHREVLPWIVASSRVDSQWFVRVGRADAYLSDIMAALVGLGVIGGPLAGLLSGKMTTGTSALDVLSKALPGIWFFVGFVALIAYIVVRVIIHQENVAERAVFARDCSRTMKGLSIQLFALLSEPDPMSKITQVQKSVNDTVANATKNSVWPYNPLPPREQIEEELDKITDQIRQSFMPAWVPAPPGEQKE